MRLDDTGVTGYTAATPDPDASYYEVRHIDLAKLEPYVARPGTVSRAPVLEDGVAYVDGGTRSVANADLARGCELLVALTPVTGLNRRPVAQAESLHVPYAVVAPNDLALTRMGRNPLDPAFRASAAEAGRQQAQREAEKIGGVWSRK